MRGTSTTSPSGVRSKELDAATGEYIRRCKILLKDAFQRDLDVRRSFRDWIDQRLQASVDPWILLHEDPLYTASRYLGISPQEIDVSILRRAERIARDQGWAAERR
jgi:hypothetical protein